MRVVLQIGVLSLLVVTVLAATTTKAPEICTFHKAMTKFDATKFAGVWYDAAHTKTSEEDNDSDVLNCDQDRYVITDPHTFSITSFSYNKTTNKVTVLEGKAEVPTNGSAIIKFTLRFRNPDKKNTDKVVTYDNRVLDTDYKTYAVLWSCDSETLPTGNALIYSRVQKPDADLVKKGVKVLENNKITDNELVESSQYGCPRFS